MAQIIQLRHTTSATNNPSSADGTSPGLIVGEPAVCVAATATKLWVGVDGVLANNRLLFSTVDGDTTFLPMPAPSFRVISGMRLSTSQI